MDVLIGLEFSGGRIIILSLSSKVFDELVVSFRSTAGFSRDFFKSQFKLSLGVEFRNCYGSFSGGFLELPNHKWFDSFKEMMREGMDESISGPSTCKCGYVNEYISVKDYVCSGCRIWSEA